MMKLCVPIFACAALSLCPPLLAQSVDARSADAKQGAAIAGKGAGGAAAACASCHGTRGEGNAAGGFPRLAGQPQYYLSRQMRAYADGGRRNPIMAQIAKALNPQQREAVSAYYAQLDAGVQKGPRPSADSSADHARRGETLATIGDAGLRVQACANCHGPGGVGEPPAYPYLAGQVRPYLQAALNEWNSGGRDTDPSGQMQIIGKQLEPRDIAAVSDYYASQPAPPAADRRGAAKAAKAGPGRKPATRTQPGAGTQATEGGGSEGGAPTMGGGQGPGGGGGASGSGASGSRSGGSP
jgi:cytochrome c553